MAIGSIWEGGSAIDPTQGLGSNKALCDFSNL